MIWIMIAIITFACLLIMLRSPRIEPVDRRASAVAHYREQIERLDLDRAASKISDSDYEMSKAEISRALLRENDTPSPREGTDDDKSMTMAYAISLALFIAGGSILFYSLKGRPDLLSLAVSEKEDMLATPVQNAGGTTYGEALQRMENHMLADPNDIQVRILYARTQSQLNSHRAASMAYRELMMLEPEKPEWQVNLIQSIMAHEKGQVTPAALLLVDQLLQTYPDLPAAHYLKGLALLQRNKKEEALTVWESFASASAPDAPWMRSFMPQIRALKYPMPEVDTANAERIMSLSEAQRMAFFTAMADRLDQKLQDIPDYPEAYLRLARVRLMTGDREAAIAALKAGIKGSSDPAQAVPLSQMLDKIIEKSDNGPNS